jgi:hypothetical protein
LTATATPAARRTARQLAEAAREAAPAPDVDPTRCPAWGCPLRGSVDPGGTGRFLCHCHAHVDMARWQEITHLIRAHEWMLAIVRQVKAAAHGQWRRTAELAWSVEPDMGPHPQETQALYVARMLMDFEWRVGARSDKPGPQLPQRTMPEFAPKHAPAASVDGATSIGSVLP